MRAQVDHNLHRHTAQDLVLVWGVRSDALVRDVMSCVRLAAITRKPSAASGGLFVEENP